MSLTSYLCGSLRIFEKLIENKHMSDTNHDTNMPGNADNRSILRTMSGQEINQGEHAQSREKVPRYDCDMVERISSGPHDDLYVTDDDACELEDEIADLERQLAEARRELNELIQKHRETKCEFCGMIPLTEKEHEWIRLHGHE